MRQATHATDHKVRSISNTERTHGPSIPGANAAKVSGIGAGLPNSPYGVRPADASDAQVLASLEQETFPELEHPTGFRRELQRAKRNLLCGEETLGAQ